LLSSESIEIYSRFIPAHLDPAGSIRDDVSAQEWQTRIDLAACYRLVDHYEMPDLIYNHITARIPGTEHLLINLYGLLYREITASSLVKIDFEGNIVWKPVTGPSASQQI
jgi:ribulose-5-phosphate 4-epimerase/fuculose-1-phosphate aldolase